MTASRDMPAQGLAPSRFGAGRMRPLWSGRTIIGLASGAFAIAMAIGLMRLGLRAPMTWLPIGIASAVFVRFGASAWPLFALGGVSAGLLLDQTWSAVLSGVAAAIIGPWAMAMYLEQAGFCRAFERRADVVRFALAVAAASMLSATATAISVKLYVPRALHADWLFSWVRWWVTASVGAMLIVPATVNVSRKTLQLLRREPLASALVASAAGVFTFLMLEPSHPTLDALSGPLAVAVVMAAAIRLDLTIAALVAGTLTAVVGMSSDSPLSSANESAPALARVWAFGLLNAMVVLTIQALRAERAGAEASLRDAERRYRLGLLQAAQQEQLRIGQELHDAIGQELTGLSLLARSVERRSQSGERVEPALGHEIVDACSRLQDATRSIVRGIPALQQCDGRLDVGLRTLVARLGSVGTPEIRVFVSGDGSPPEPVAEAVFRIAQEALNNAIKHADASRIDLHLTMLTERVSLRVTDNGTGLPRRLAGNEGFGFDTMRYRAEAIGGTIAVTSAPEQGTTVTLEWSDRK